MYIDVVVFHFFASMIMNHARPHAISYSLRRRRVKKIKEEEKKLKLLIDIFEYRLGDWMDYEVIVIENPFWVLLQQQRVLMPHYERVERSFWFHFRSLPPEKNNVCGETFMGAPLSIKLYRRNVISSNMKLRIAIHQLYIENGKAISQQKRDFVAFDRVT